MRQMRVNVGQAGCMQCLDACSSGGYYKETDGGQTARDVLLVQNTKPVHGGSSTSDDDLGGAAPNVYRLSIAVIKNTLYSRWPGSSINYHDMPSRVVYTSIRRFAVH